MSETNGPAERWRKAEFHAHCDADPMDYRVCSYSAKRLISEAAGQGYEILAITCHDRDIWTRELSDFAEQLGITLIPGMEATVETSRHLLAYNFHTGCGNLDRLDKVRSLVREDTLVIAPHSFYPGPTCLRGRTRGNVDLFDALEISGFYTPLLDFNRRVWGLAKEHQKPLVANGDIHFLWQLGRSFSWVLCRPGVTSVIDAVKRGKVRIESAPLSLLEAAGWWAATVWRTLFPVNRKPSDPQFDPIYE